jgi:hypothetical protein
MVRSRLRVVLQGTYGGAIVHGRAFVIRAGSEVELNDFFSRDFAWPGHHGDVIVGCDETTGRVEAETRAEFTFYAEAEQLQLSDRDDGLVKVLRGHNGGRRHGWPSIRRGFLGRSRRG